MSPSHNSDTVSANNTSANTLNTLLAEAGAGPLSPMLATQFHAYLELLLRWNERTNLTSIREPAEILRRHFVESILAARALPSGLATLLDFGSGAGFPGIPIALCRPEIAVTLAESQHKKAAFLREAVRVLGLGPARPDTASVAQPVHVHAARAEQLTRRFDAVTLRAVDNMAAALAAALPLVGDRGWLVVLTTTPQIPAIEAAIEAAIGGSVADAAEHEPAGSHPTSSQPAGTHPVGSHPAMTQTPANQTATIIHWQSPIPLALGREQVILMGQRHAH